MLHEHKNVCLKLDKLTQGLLEPSLTNVTLIFLYIVRIHTNIYIKPAYMNLTCRGIGTRGAFAYLCSMYPWVFRGIQVKTMYGFLVCIPYDLIAPPTFSDFLPPLICIISTVSKYVVQTKLSSNALDSWQTKGNFWLRNALWIWQVCILHIKIWKFCPEEPVLT